MNFKKLAELTPIEKSRYTGLPIQVGSYDDGYSSKKGYSEHVPNGVVLPTIMGATTRRMQKSSALLGAQDINGVEYKTTQDDTMRYLFGKHADEQLGTVTGKSSDDVQAGNIKLQQFFAATLRMLFPKPGQYHVRMVVMMPVVAFQQDAAFEKNVIDTLCGVYTFAALTHFTDGEPIYENFEFYVDRVMVIEQPLGTFLYSIYTEQDDAVVKRLARKRKAVLDWGAGTLDVLVIENDEGKQRRIDRMCGSTAAGINILFDYVRDEIFVPAGLTPSRTVLEEAVMEGRYKLNIHRSLWPASADEKGYIDLKPSIERGLDAIWQASLQLFDATIGLRAEDIDFIMPTGGTAGWLQQQVCDHFGEERVVKVLTNPTIDPEYPYEHLMRSKDLHLRNAHGGYLYAKRIK